MVSADDGNLTATDPSLLVKKLSEEKRNVGSRNFAAAVTSFEDFAATLADDLDNNSEAYAKGLVSLIQAVMLSDALLSPFPEVAERLLVGIRTPDATGQPDPYFVSLLRWLSFKHATGVDATWLFRSKRPTPKQLLQQVAFGMLAGCDDSDRFGVPREVVVEVLEDAFRTISSKDDKRVYAPTFDTLDLELVMLQFGIMLVLCRLYRLGFEQDRTKNMKCLFTHAEAARIMIVVRPQQYQGHMEVAWNDLTKMLHGIQFVTPEAWDQARESAKRAVALANKAQNDYALARSIYDLAFLLAVGPREETFDLGEVKTLLFDVDQVERRLELWGMRSRVHFHCSSRKYLLALKREWERPSGPAANAKSAKGAKGKETSAAAKPPKSAWPITDWRCFDQRNQGYYTWLEPPNQEGDINCAGCGIPLVRVHRCDVCKSAAFCSSICYTANVDKHDPECSPAPKPWLSPPGSRPPPALPELGEEGYLGFLPWWVVKYGLLALLSYALYWLLERLEDIRHAHGLAGWASMFQALQVLLAQGVGWVQGFLGIASASRQDPASPALEAGFCGADGTECPAGEFEH